jgi:hypothetical protein
VPDQATAVLLDSDGVEMSEPVPARYDGHDVVIDHVLYVSRAAYATWIEVRAPGHKPLRALVRQDVGYGAGYWMKSSDTIKCSPMSITVD